jgi:hypothetical protein
MAENEEEEQVGGLKMISLFKRFSRCRYAEKCLFYQPEGHTCNHPTAENGYCGYYRVFKELEEEEQNG